MTSGTPAGAADVTVVILNRDGRDHLATSVPAALALSGLAGPEAVLVADDGSTDGSLDYVLRECPGVRTVGWQENLGFAQGNNRALDEVRTEHVLFLNNDTAVQPDALGFLLREAGAGADLVGARLVSWDGLHLDFDGGAASFTGHGHPLGRGRPVSRDGGPPHDTLFACGAAMLARTAAFRSLGGFAATYFAYYEDVDLGWRYHLAGRGVRHVPAAVVRHRGGASAGLLAAGRAGRLHERNAIATVVRNYGDEALRRVLPAALSLAAVRAGAAPSVMAQALAATRAWPPLPPSGWSGWPYLAPLRLDWEALLSERAETQALRTRPDAEVLPCLAWPLAAVPPSTRGWAALAQAHSLFDLGALFGPMPRRPLAAAAGAALAWRRTRRRPGARRT